MTTEYEVTVMHATGVKCARCWKYSADVGVWSDLPDVCERCADAVLLHDTGYGLQDHVMAKWDAGYRKAVSEGLSGEEADSQATLFAGTRGFAYDL